MKRNGNYWTVKEKEALAAAVSFSELSFIALDVLKRMPDNVSQVCGPISTGGLGNIKDNMEVFDATINYLIQQGGQVFDLKNIFPVSCLIIRGIDRISRF